MNYKGLKERKLFCDIFIFKQLFSFANQVVGQAEEADPMHPNLDDFTSLLGQDDARMLVDLLKLAVAGRAVDTAKEIIVNVLVGEFFKPLRSMVEHIDQYVSIFCVK